jgi:hypothetical protein
MNEANVRLPLRLVFPILLIYLVISIAGMYYHELFLDEAHHFLIGRDSDSVAAVYNNLRYDGHPRLWSTILFFITHYITSSPYGMQVFHLMITTCTVFFFLRYAPFSLAVKLLVLSGYYFLFEYNLLSRNYALGILFLFICCHLLKNPEKYLLLIGFFLLLLCNTHVFYTFASIGIFLYLFIEYARQRKLFSTPFLLFSLLFLTGFACALIQARTPGADNVNMTPVKPAEWLSVKNFSFAVYGVIRGWLPIPLVSSGHFWNTYWLNDRNTGVFIKDILFAACLVFPAMILGRNLKVLVFYYSGVFFLFIFFVVTQMQASRYFGMVYIFFLAAAWMTSDGVSDVFSFRSIPGPPAIKRLLQISLYLILSVQVLVGIYALEQDFTRPFSQSKNAVKYIKGVQGNQVIAVDGYNAGPMLCAYLEKKVFYLDIGREGSFCVWKKSYFPVPRLTIGQEMSQSVYLQGLDRFILISNRKIDTVALRAGPRSFHVASLKNFDNSIIGENFYIYQVTEALHDPGPL